MTRRKGLAREDNLYVEIGRRVKLFRGQKKQEEIAGLVGLTRTSISNIERGRQRIPAHTLLSLAEALAVAPRQLLPHDGERSPGAARVGLSADPARAFVEQGLQAATESSWRRRKGS